MECSAEDFGGPPESWEDADLNDSMKKLVLSTKTTSSCSSSPSLPELVDAPDSASILEDSINTVDQFLREAIQNPRERLSVLRMEQDVEKFIQDPTQQQMEFQQLPTSYLRLAAHRVAQHYSLQSMVLLDNNQPDGSDSRIIVCKTSECQLPLIRLADFPVNLPTEDNSVIKVAIKQRPQGRLNVVNSANSQSVKPNNSKSVEERKEEYNRARARIFNSSSFSGSSGAKPEIERRTQDNLQHGSPGISEGEEKSVPGGSDLNFGRASVDSPASSSRLARSRTAKEPVDWCTTNSRVAVFRDRDVDCKDPDYDRNYDRYLQRFDPGFGINGGLYTIQPMYSPALNYNTEFPQLGSAHRTLISSEHQSRPLPHHVHGQWATPSTPAGIGYGPPESMMTPFSPYHVGGSSTSGLYLHSTQYPSQCPGMPFIHPYEQVNQTFSQSHQLQLDASFGLAPPR